MTQTRQNRLIRETSPYLLQHARNPVDWWPWCPEAFEQARREDKPVFLSIGYSTCHWCHVMERESFEDREVAEVLNRGFISVKVDKEERPDIDSVYMDVCQTVTGGGGWPLTILMTPEQKPFFAGTYFPKTTRPHSIGLIDLLDRIKAIWDNDRERLLQAGDEAVQSLKAGSARPSGGPGDLTARAVSFFKKTFDGTYGGFGAAPKFPSPHNLIFLLRHYEISQDPKLLHMAEKTLAHMYRGGLFDHVGYGFSRYSTDRAWLAPHFEKMLYDNALLTLAYLEAYRVTKKEVYKNVAVKILTYVSRELTAENGGFFCAQDADSEGEEGKYYVFTPEEIHAVLGMEAGASFNRRFDITSRGNFEGKNIPNLIRNEAWEDDEPAWLPPIYAYRKGRAALHLDDKILSSWNGLMIAALAEAYRLLGDEAYLRAAQKAERFLSDNLCDGARVFASFREGRRGENGFLDDHAAYAFALLALYGATYDKTYWHKAEAVARQTLSDFTDETHPGFYLYGRTSQPLIHRPMETYDGALPSGNSVMAYTLVKLAGLTQEPEWEAHAQKKMDFMASCAAGHPAGHSFFLMALQARQFYTQRIVCALKHREEWPEIQKDLPYHAAVVVYEGGNREYPIKDGQTTFYLCDHNGCRPPVHQKSEIRGQRSGRSAIDG